MNYLKLEYLEMEGHFALFIALSDNEAQKCHRIAVRIPVLGKPSDVVAALRTMADDIERKFS